MQISIYCKKLEEYKLQNVLSLHYVTNIYICTTKTLVEMSPSQYLLVCRFRRLSTPGASHFTTSPSQDELTSIG